MEEVKLNLQNHEIEMYFYNQNDKDVIEFLIAHDNKLFDNSPSYLKPCGLQEKEYVINQTKVKFKRHRYKDLRSNKYVYLLDQFLGVKKWNKIPKYEQENIQKCVAKDKFSYRMVVERYCNKFSISVVSGIMMMKLVVEIKKQERKY